MTILFKISNPTPPYHNYIVFTTLTSIYHIIYFTYMLSISPQNDSSFKNAYTFVYFVPFVYSLSLSLSRDMGKA